LHWNVVFALVCLLAVCGLSFLVRCVDLFIYLFSFCAPANLLPPPRVSHSLIGFDFFMSTPNTVFPLSTHSHFPTPSPLSIYLSLSLVTTTTPPPPEQQPYTEYAAGALLDVCGVGSVDELRRRINRLHTAVNTAWEVGVHTWVQEVSFADGRALLSPLGGEHRRLSLLWGPLSSPTGPTSGSTSACCCEISVDLAAEFTASDLEHPFTGALSQAEVLAVRLCGGTEREQLCARLLSVVGARGIVALVHAALLRKRVLFFSADASLQALGETVLSAFLACTAPVRVAHAPSLPLLLPTCHLHELRRIADPVTGAGAAAGAAAGGSSSSTSTSSSASSSSSSSSSTATGATTDTENSGEPTTSASASASSAALVLKASDRGYFAAVADEKAHEEEALWDVWLNLDTGAVEFSSLNAKLQVALESPAAHSIVAGLSQPAPKNTRQLIEVGRCVCVCVCVCVCLCVVVSSSLLLRDWSNAPLTSVQTFIDSLSLSLFVPAMSTSDRSNTRNGCLIMGVASTRISNHSRSWHCWSNALIFNECRRLVSSLFTIQ
jgi:hypothetical protein